MVTETERQLYHKLSHYAQTHQLALPQFWTCPRYCLTLEQFIDLLANIGFILAPEEQQELEQNQVEFISLQTIIAEVTYWREQEGTVGAYVTKQAKLASTNREGSISQSVAKVSNKANKEKTLERQWKKEWKLNETLLRTKNQGDYQLTVKVGQANDLCKRLKNNCSYLIECGEDGSLKIVEEGKGGSRVLSKKVFGQLYEKLKLQALNKGEEWQGSLEQDLKKTLVEVMYLSGQLQEQIKLLQDKGVTH